LIKKRWENKKTLKTLYIYVLNSTTPRTTRYAATWDQLLIQKDAGSYDNSLQESPANAMVSAR